MEHAELLDTAVLAARRAAEIIMHGLGRISPGDVSTKQASDYVTRVDRESEHAIVGAIRERHPDHGFLAEESADISDGIPEAEGYRWIIDPLDGTTNYIHQYPMFSVSIALQLDGRTVLGVVLDPQRDELFHAIFGGGAFLNGVGITVSPPGTPGGALVATGFPFRRKEMIDTYLAAFKGVFLHAGDLRRGGSAALDLSHLAAGRCDGFFEIGLNPWDIAAGALMITEAGGVVTDFAGGSEYLDTGNIVAGNTELHATLIKIVKEAFKGKVDK